MLRLYDITDQTASGITFSTEEILDADVVPYILYDTSTGTTNLKDYVVWRALTSKTDPTDTNVLYTIDNTNLYPSYTSNITDYTTLDLSLLKTISLDEYRILTHLLNRIDLVRKRLPNPGTVIQDTDGVGDGGVVSFAGGWDKKFNVEELFTFIEGALVEINIHPPATAFFWNYQDIESDKNPNPYVKTAGIPYRMQDLIVQGAMIRALISWGILEVDVHFTTSDSGLSISYDRVGYVKSWHDSLLAEYKQQKDLIKWDFVNSYGMAVGTVAFSAMGIMGAVAGMIEQHGVIPMNSLLGAYAQANKPL